MRGGAVIQIPFRRPFPSFFFLSQISLRGTHLGAVHTNGALFKAEAQGNYRLSPAHKCVLAAAIPWFCERLTKSTFKVRLVDRS